MSTLRIFLQAWAEVFSFMNLFCGFMFGAIASYWIGPSLAWIVVGSTIVLLAGLQEWRSSPSAPIDSTRKWPT